MSPRVSASSTAIATARVRLLEGCQCCNRLRRNLDRQPAVVPTRDAERARVGAMVGAEVREMRGGVDAAADQGAGGGARIADGFGAVDDQLGDAGAQDAGAEGA